MKKLIFPALIVVSLGACGKSHVGYSSMPYPHTSSSGSSASGKMPSGNGGYYKTGKPYKVGGQWYYPLQTAAGYEATGTASWYGRDFHGKKTANGERYDMYAMSAAHKTLPMPSLVRVTNLENGRSVVVRVNDRGPFVKSRLIDLSYAAAKELGYDNKGTARVRVQVIGNNNSAPVSAAAPRQPALPRAVEHRTASVPTPVSAPAPVASAPNGSMFIQLGAFSSQANAQRLQGELAASHPTVQVYPDYRTTPGIFRVRIGPFQDVEEIESQVLSLREQGYSQAIVVIK